MTSDLKPILKALKVPWFVSPSVSAMLMKCEENGNAVIYVNAFLGKHCSENPDRRVKLTFHPAIYCAMFPSESDLDVIGENKYDWSYISGMKLQNESIEERQKRFEREWMVSGVCPDPHIYKVYNSPLNFKYAKEFNNYLIIGADGYIEVIAENCVWEYE